MPLPDLAEEPVEAEPSGGKGKQGGNKGKGSGGKGRDIGPHRGGWLPNIAKLVIAVLEQNIGRAQYLARGYCESSRCLNTIVEKRFSSSSSSTWTW